MRLGSIFGIFDGKKKTDAISRNTPGNSPAQSPGHDGPSRSSKDGLPLVLHTPLDEIVPITPQDLEVTLSDLATNAKPWKDGEFKFIKTLQDAVRNHGRVDLMDAAGSSGGPENLIAVKRMPNRWMRTGPKEFKEQYPSASERPWFDLAFIKQLNMRGLPYVCDFIDILRDDGHTYVGMALATEGDLFGWCDCEPRPSAEREDVMRPLVVQMFTAVQLIHSLGIAHRDLSLENILLTRDERGELLVKVIDFGMGTLTRVVAKEIRGKQSYQAPEMHLDEEYDGFLTDAFALGVVVFAMSVQDYPWISTKRNTCQLFEYVSTYGLIKLLERRKLRKGKGEHLVEVLTKGLTEMLVALLAVKSQDRAALGEPCWAQAHEGRSPSRDVMSARKSGKLSLRMSVWDMEWLSGQGGRPLRQK